MNDEINRRVGVGQQKEWVGEVRGMHAGLMAIAIIMIQPFMYQGELVGVAAHICVFAFALSVPILASLLLLNFSEEFKHHLSLSKKVSYARVVGQIAAVIGVVAGFWHISPVAGGVAIVGGVFGAVAYSAGYRMLYRKSK